MAITHEPELEIDTTFMDNSKCGCWAALKRGVAGAYKSSASRDSANTIPRTSLVYDAGMFSVDCLDVPAFL